MQTESQGKGMAEQLRQAQANHDFKDDTPSASQGGNNDVPVIENVSMPDITFQEESKPQPQEQPQNVEQSEIRLGSRVFKSNAELQGYLEQLENTKGRYEAVQAQFQPQQAQVQPEEDLEQLMWSNPKRYAEVIEERAINKLQQRQDDAQRRKDIEDRFYRTYSDLGSAKTIVKAITSELAAKNELAGLTEDAALSKIAQAARRELYAIRGQKMPTEELASGPVRVAGSSSGAPVQSGVQAQKPKSMVEQMKALRRKG